jgi:UDPglucose 6-dehydrogenase
MNTVSIIGTGYVGLVTGTCLSEFGMNVTCMDVDERKIKKLKEGILTIYEPGLEQLYEKNYNSGRLKFSTDIKEAVDYSTIIFIAVGTPPMEDGSADLQYVLSAARSIAENMDGYKVIVNKSTVPVGTGKKVKSTIKEVLCRRNVNYKFDIVSNPEFLREGAAVRDFMHPDRIVIGAESEEAKNIMRNIYNVLYLIDTPFVFTNLETAELIKYASNAFLATKIGFINEIANLCDAIGANVNDVSRAMGMDGRIGKYFLHAGPGFGGSCFPKDTKALVNIGNEYDTEMSIVKSVISSNENQRRLMVEKILYSMGDLRGKVIGVLGLAFKPETDDIREAPALSIINELIRQGARVKVYDPIAMDNAREYAFYDVKSMDARYDFEGHVGDDVSLVYCSDEYQAAEDAQAIVIVTEWNQFRNMDLLKIKGMMKGDFFFDLRNVYERSKVEKCGFIYTGVGR